MKVQELMRRLMAMDMNAEVRVHLKKLKSAPRVSDVTAPKDSVVFIHLEPNKD